MKNAASSALFAVMVTDGGGAMVDTLEHAVPQKAGLLSLGVIDKAGGVSAFAPGRDVPSQTVPFACLKDEAPAPFKQEVDAGSGRHIHHKFVVCDFNGAQPVVFCGSSNLSRGGEEQNGDGLIAMHDPAIVTAYAIEAVRLFDHYRFRASQPAGAEGDRCVGRTVLRSAQHQVHRARAVRPVDGNGRRAGLSRAGVKPARKRIGEGGPASIMFPARAPVFSTRTSVSRLAWRIGRARTRT